MTHFETESARTLLQLATKHEGIDATACAGVFAGLSRADRSRCELRSALARHRLSELQFAILVLLLVAEPTAVPMAVLARKAGVSRAAISDAFDGLVRLRLAVRDRYGADRRIVAGRLTASGRKMAEQAIADYLRAVVRVASTCFTP